MFVRPGCKLVVARRIPESIAQKQIYVLDRSLDIESSGTRGDEKRALRRDSDCVLS